MDQITDMARDMAESSEAFEDQFNPNSIHFHKGLPTPVPIGGARVPESMPTAYPEKVEDLASYIAADVINYGPEYDLCLSEREFFNNTLKKAIQKVCTQVEALYRHKETFKKAGKKDHTATFERNMERDTVKLKEGVAELNQCRDVLMGNVKYQERYAELNKIIPNAEQDFETKDQVAEFGFAAKRITALAFKDSQLLMDQIKKIKKEYKPTEKPEEPPKVPQQQEESKQQ